MAPSPALQYPHDPIHDTLIPSLLDYREYPDNHSTDTGHCSPPRVFCSSVKWRLTRTRIGWTGVSFQIWTTRSNGPSRRVLSDYVSIFLMMATSPRVSGNIENGIYCQCNVTLDSKHVCWQILMWYPHMEQRQFYFNKSPSIAQFYCCKRQTLLQ